MRRQITSWLCPRVTPLKTPTIVSTIVFTMLSHFGEPLLLLAQNIPMRADVIGITDGMVEYELTNVGPKSATAWAVEFTSTDSTGRKNQSTEIRDNYATTALSHGEPTLANLLTPKSNRQMTAHLAAFPGGVIVNAQARVVAVIWDDGTSIGDSVVIDRLFASRAADRDTYAALIVEVQATKANGGRLEDLEDKLIANKPKFDVPGVVEGLVQNLGMQKQRISLGQVNESAALDTIEQVLTLEHKAAIKHSARTK
jgi:hypothetical protein